MKFVITPEMLENNGLLSDAVEKITKRSFIKGVAIGSFAAGAIMYFLHINEKERLENKLAVSEEEARDWHER